VDDPSRPSPAPAAWHRSAVWTAGEALRGTPRLQPRPRRVRSE
jgi:hypothetical protein